MVHPSHVLPRACDLQCLLAGDPVSCPSGSGLRSSHQTISPLCHSCCPRPVHLILKHIPMCCGGFPHPPPHFTALFECALILRRVYNEGGPEQPVLTLLLLPPPSPGLPSFGLQARCW